MYDDKLTFDVKQLLEKHVSLRLTDFSFETVSSYMSRILSANEIIMNELDWWQANQSKYLMAKLARAIFAIPATAAPCERVWSASGLLIDEQDGNV